MTEPELWQRAVRMVMEVVPDYESQRAAITSVALKLSIGSAETVRKWVRQAEVDAGQRSGVSTDEIGGVEAVAAGERRVAPGE